MQKDVNLVDLIKSFPTNILLQNLASIQKRTSPIKFDHLAENQSRVRYRNFQIRSFAPAAPAMRASLVALAAAFLEGQPAKPVVERFDIEPYSDFSAE